MAKSAELRNSLLWMRRAACTARNGRVVTSMNEYVEQLPDDTYVTVFKFNSESWETHYDGKKSKWERMEVGDYNPNNMTPLFDAISRSVKHADKPRQRW